MTHNYPQQQPFGPPPQHVQPQIQTMQPIHGGNQQRREESFQSQATVFILKDKTWREQNQGTVRFVFDLNTYALRLVIAPNTPEEMDRRLRPRIRSKGPRAYVVRAQAPNNGEDSILAVRFEREEDSRNFRRFVEKRDVDPNQNNNNNTNNNTNNTNNNNQIPNPNNNTNNTNNTNTNNHVHGHIHPNNTPNNGQTPNNTHPNYGNQPNPYMYPQQQQQMLMQQYKPNGEYLNQSYPYNPRDPSFSYAWNQNGYPNQSPGGHASHSSTMVNPASTPHHPSQSSGQSGVPSSYNPAPYNVDYTNQNHHISRNNITNGPSSSQLPQSVGQQQVQAQAQAQQQVSGNSNRNLRLGEPSMSQSRSHSHPHRQREGIKNSSNAGQHGSSRHQKSRHEPNRSDSHHGSNGSGSHVPVPPSNDSSPTVLKLTEENLEQHNKYFATDNKRRNIKEIILQQIEWQRMHAASTGVGTGDQMHAI